MHFCRAIHVLCIVWTLNSVVTFIRLFDSLRWTLRACQGQVHANSKSRQKVLACCDICHPPPKKTFLTKHKYFLISFISGFEWCNFLLLRGKNRPKRAFQKVTSINLHTKWCNWRVKHQTIDIKFCIGVDHIMVYNNLRFLKNRKFWISSFFSKNKKVWHFGG